MSGDNKMAERIQKVLARAGYGSRRGLEVLIKAGQVTVNGGQAKLGDQISMGDTVRLEGKVLSAKRLWQQALPQVLLYNKPVGEVCSRKDPEGRRTIFQSLPAPDQGRWVSVGRLDITTSGLIILTTDGELANRLMHPSNEMDREYAVRVLGEVTPEIMQILRDGVELEDGIAKFMDIQRAGGDGANQWYHVVIQEGRNREVRRLWESQGLQVSRLMRVRYGPIIIPNQLKMGKWQLLEADDLAMLYEEVELVPQVAAEEVGKGRRNERMAKTAPLPKPGRGRKERPARVERNPRKAQRKSTEDSGKSTGKSPRLRGR
jgi:23S rRNA pseudouridine2605 synthase